MATAPTETKSPQQTREVYVLIVDDDPSARALMRAAVEGLSFPCRVSEADDSDEALRIARQARPDLVLLDLVLPESSNSGAIVCKELSADLRTKVVIVSGQPPGPMIDLCFKAGAAEYINKPFSIPDLRAKVERLLRT